MALDMERPSAAVNSSRSQSPQEQRTGPTLLKFSIEQILSPDFGQKHAEKRQLGTTHMGTHKMLPETTRPSFPVKNSVSPYNLLPQVASFAWLRCSRTSDRPSSGPRRIRSKTGRGGSSQDFSDDEQSPRSRRIKKKDKKPDDKRPRTAFTADQLNRLKQEFQDNRYLTEKRRQDLSRELKLNESQVKIWFQNRRAKLKKSSGTRSELALQLMAEGLYNHSTIPIRDDDDDNERPKSSSSS